METTSDLIMFGIYNNNLMNYLLRERHIQKKQQQQYGFELRFRHRKFTQ